MGPAYINYIASVVFASITFILFFQYFAFHEDRIPMLLVIAGAGCAWGGAYCAATYQIYGGAWGALSSTLTALAVIIILILLALAIRTAFNA